MSILNVKGMSTHIYLKSKVMKIKKFLWIALYMLTLGVISALIVAVLEIHNVEKFTPAVMFFVGWNACVIYFAIFIDVKLKSDCQ